MTPDVGPSIRTVQTLTAGERTQVAALDRAAALADGVPALDAQVRLDLQYADPTVRHVLARRPGADIVAGYAHLRFRGADGGPATTTQAADLSAGTPVGHLVVDPRLRRAGAGSALLASMQQASADGLQVWAHGDLAPARQLADRVGMHRTRELWRMHRELAAPTVPPSYPPDVTVRQFVVGVDEKAWLALNALSFADHPEQGSVSAEGLGQRMAQPDFDPAGFFLAERDGALLGFHWTKVHPPGELGPNLVGEVYVLGVHPDAQGLGLGKALTLTGLRSLQSRGIREVILYVEGENAPAISVYARLGFTRAAVDVLYATD
jgi:mycothiol synthase